MQRYQFAAAHADFHGRVLWRVQFEIGIPALWSRGEQQSAFAIVLQQHFLQRQHGIAVVIFSVKQWRFRQSTSGTSFLIAIPFLTWAQ